jgi:hypothetical protein
VAAAVELREGDDLQKARAGAASEANGPKASLFCSVCTAERAAAHSAGADAQRTPQGKTKQLPKKVDASTGGYIISYNETLDLCVPTLAALRLQLCMFCWRARVSTRRRCAVRAPRHQLACRARPPTAPAATPLR